MSNITDEVKLKSGQEVVEEPNNTQYHRWDDGSAEIEVLEFLYALTRLIKPNNVLETGTYKGFSGAYMALGLRDNGMGHLDTVEWERAHIETAKELWSKLNVMEYITEYYMSSMEFTTDKTYELVLLDTEPGLRFKELDKFWNNFKPGAIIVIHDLSWDLGSGSQFWTDRDLIEKRIKNKELSVIHFYSPRGLSLFRKTCKEGDRPDYFYKLLTMI